MTVATAEAVGLLCAGMAARPVGSGSAHNNNMKVWRRVRNGYP
jgi:hypothetical protein